jgi:copper chaperone CopZ
MCATALSGSLSKAGANVGEIFSEAKQINVSYDPAKVTLHQVIQSVAETEPVHPGSRYQAGVLVTIDVVAKNATKVKGALKKVKGVVDFAPVPGATNPGDIMVALAPLSRAAKPTDHVKASHIAEALEKAGVKFSGIETSRGGAAAADDKKNPGAKSSAKAKPGDDESPGEKSKPTRSPPTPKSKPTREPSAPPKAKEDSADKPRFEILAQASGKIYLVDRETKSDEGKELKKFVKAGDTFGDYTVKETGDDDGLFVILEHTETKETIRVEREKKEKGEKPKDEAKPAKPAGDADSKV